MSECSPQRGIVLEQVEAQRAQRQRAAAMRWLPLNGALFAICAYDLWCACSGYTSMFYYVEMCLAAVLAANAVQHACHLLAPTYARSSQPQLQISPSKTSIHSEMTTWPPDALICREPPSPPSPPSPRSMNTPRSPCKDQFIADRHILNQYLRQHESSVSDPQWSTAGPSWSPNGALCSSGSEAAAPRRLSYHLAPFDNESGASGAVEGASGGDGGAQALRRLHLEPQRLTEYLLNLRLWLHVTILERLVRELDRLDALLAAAGAGAEARLGSVTLERLTAAAAAVPGASVRLAALMPFLEPFSDQRYLVRRVRELARGGCLSGYRWDGGGTDWETGGVSRPTDAELVAQLFASYMDTQLPGGGRPFSRAHMSVAPVTPPRGPRALALHRASVPPSAPHYVLALGDETLEVARGRDNLLITLLVFVAAAGRSDPPAIHRVHLGRAGLNLLWVIGR